MAATPPPGFEPQWYLDFEAAVATMQQLLDDITNKNTKEYQDGQITLARANKYRDQIAGLVAEFPILIDLANQGFQYAANGSAFITILLHATNGTITSSPVVNPAPNYILKIGTVLTLTAVPAANYHFDSWSAAADLDTDMADDSTDNPLIVTMPNFPGNVYDITANFVHN